MPSREALEHQRGGLRVVLAQRLGAFEHRDLRAEAAMGLRHFHADGAAADDDQVPGPLAQVEDRLVGVVRRLLEPRDRRHKGAGAGGDHEAARLDDMGAGLHLGFRDEAGEVADDMDAEVLEPFLAVDGGDRVDDALHMVLGGGEIWRGRVAGDAEGGLAGVMRLVPRGQQRLGGHAAVVETVAPHLVALDQDDLRAHLDRARRRRRGRRTRRR
jgi:hypothetical protein